MNKLKMKLKGENSIYSNIIHNKILKNKCNQGDERLTH